MQPWFDLLMEVLPEVEGVPAPLARRKCIEAARRFCQHTQALTGTAEQDLVSGMRTYEFVLTPDHDVVLARHVWVNGMPIRPLIEGHTWSDGREAPYRYQGGGETISLLWTPTADVTNGLRATFVLKPSYLSASGDDLFFGEYRSTIAAGAKALLMQMPGREWSSPQHSAMYLDEFRGDINRAHGQVLKRWTGADTQVSMRPFAHGRRSFA